MKFIKGQTKKPQYPITVSNIPELENFIESTKIMLDDYFNNCSNKPKKPNVSKKELKAIKQTLANPNIIIKPADKNLGIVVLDSTDYVDQCLEHLSSETYMRTTNFPANNIIKIIEGVLLKFKSLLTPHKKLYQHLLPSHQHQIPKLYGLPKLHKPLNNNGIPPIRPIISHSNSLLSHTAQFINHVLQPLAQHYEDYIKNSTDLIIYLEEFTATEDIILVTLDVKSPIPQQECLNIVHGEMYKYSDLVIFDPNLITHLLQVNINNNYFQFAETTFLQLQGTAMGASFSPTIANIFMSVFLRNFLKTVTEKPVFLKRYIDDIFMLWPKKQNLERFLYQLNNFHKSIKFTSTNSNKAIDFLHLTIFKDQKFEQTKKLSISTYQKTNKLYQYLHHSSNHPQSVFKGLVKGEAIRYVRTNSSKSLYNSQINTFIHRLKERGYRLNFIKKCLKCIEYKKRWEYIMKAHEPTKQPPVRSIFKCVYSHNYHQIKEIIISNFNEHELQQYTNTPTFAFLRGKTIGNMLVRANTNLQPKIYKRSLQGVQQQQTEIILY